MWDFTAAEGPRTACDTQQLRMRAGLEALLMAFDFDHSLQQRT
jgi:hypothetical protein